ncbi:MAG: DUF5384 family protein [Candidatus Aphodousia sp.]|nr:DUF5384 family protein [Sutterella sp.]MDY2899770.1 DUF5384 family protein [Candidatus Aphodousia sp.]
MLKNTLIATAVCAVVMPASAQMSMDQQIANIRQAELEIQALDAAKEHERQEAQKRAADIQRRAEQARQKTAAAKAKEAEARKKKLQAYDDQERELDIELKRLDVELKRAQVDLQKKMAQAKGDRANEFIQSELDAARANVQSIQNQIDEVKAQQ